jgi:hypothetical protein
MVQRQLVSGGGQARQRLEYDAENRSVLSAATR